MVATKPQRVPVECYLCGRPITRDATDPRFLRTRDHVPPQGFIPKPRPANLITLPCCRACQDEYQRDEDEFRNNLGALAPASVNAAARVTWETAKRAFKRGPGVTKDFVSRLQRVAVPRADGSTEDRLALAFDAAQTRRVIHKVGCGLLYHHLRQRPRADQPLEVEWDTHLDAAEYQPMIDASHYRDSFGRAFAYVGLVVAGSRDSIWLMWFFEHHMASVAFLDAVPTCDS